MITALKLVYQDNQLIKKGSLAPYTYPLLVYVGHYDRIHIGIGGTEDTKRG